jgi:DNA-binding NarL/FixJ family response regulator
MQPVPEVVAAVSITALYDRSSSEPPDVVLVDVTQDIGMDEVALVAAKWCNLPLLALGLLERRDEVVRHGRAGFVGYVARDATIEDLQSAISDAVAGRMRCPAEISGGLIRALFNRQHPSAPRRVVTSLSKRETEVLQMIGRGLSNKEIARDLDLSLSTIKCHVHNVLTKLGVGHRSHAMHKVRAEPWIGARF